jgi:hypothetical protein
MVNVRPHYAQAAFTVTGHDTEKIDAIAFREAEERGNSPALSGFVNHGPQEFVPDKSGNFREWSGTSVMNDT